MCPHSLFVPILIVVKVADAQKKVHDGANVGAVILVPVIEEEEKAVQDAKQKAEAEKAEKAARKSVRKVNVVECDVLCSNDISMIWCRTRVVVLVLNLMERLKQKMKRREVMRRNQIVTRNHLKTNRLMMERQMEIVSLKRQPVVKQTASLQRRLLERLIRKR